MSDTEVEAIFAKINLIERLEEKFHEALDKQLLVLRKKIQSNLILPPLKWKNSEEERRLFFSNEPDLIYVYIRKGMGIDWLVEFASKRYMNLITDDGIRLKSHVNEVKAYLYKNNPDFDELKKKHNIIIASDQLF